MLKRPVVRPIVVALTVVLLGFGCKTKQPAPPPIQDVMKSESIPDSVIKDFEVKKTETPEVPVEQKVSKPSKKKTVEKKVVVTAAHPEWSQQIDKCGFKVGEKTEWDISFIGVPAGKLTTTIEPVSVVKDRPAIHFKTIGETSKFFGIFRVRAYGVADAYIDKERFSSIRFNLDLEDTWGTRKRTELFDHEKNEAYFWQRRDHISKGLKEKKMTSALVPGSLDPVGVLYYVRCKNLHDGDRFEIRMHTEGKNRGASVWVEKREVLRTPAGKFPAVKLKARMLLEGMMRSENDGENDIDVWLSDDPRHIVLKIKMKIKFGALNADLTDYSEGKGEGF